MATTVSSCVSGFSELLFATGNVRATPCCRRGATIIMMMSSTSITSTSGVTLMSDFGPSPLPPACIAIVENPLGGGLLDEVVDQLGRGVVHLHVEVLEAVRQVVVEPHGRDRDEQPERGLDERFRDADRHGADAA